MTDDKRHVVDLYADAKAADADYREAEHRYQAGRGKAPIGAPMLLTLMCLTEDDAHEIVESIKEHGGVLVSAAGMHTKTVHCSVADLRCWGKYGAGNAPDGNPKYHDRPEV